MNNCNLEASQFNDSACFNDDGDMYLDDPSEGGDNDEVNLGQYSYRRSR